MSAARGLAVEGALGQRLLEPGALHLVHVHRPNACTHTKRTNKGLLFTTLFSCWRLLLLSTLKVPSTRKFACMCVCFYVLVHLHIFMCCVGWSCFISYSPGHTHTHSSRLRMKLDWVVFSCYQRQYNTYNHHYIIKGSDWQPMRLNTQQKQQGINKNQPVDSRDCSLSCPF